MKRKSKLEVSIQFLLWKMGKPWRRVGGKILKSLGIKETRRTWPTHSTRQGSYGQAENEAASTGPSWVCIRPSVPMLELFPWWLCGTLNSGSRCMSDCFACSWDYFPTNAPSCPASIFCLVLPYLVLSCLTASHGGLLFFWRENQRASGPVGASGSERRRNWGLDAFQ